MKKIFGMLIINVLLFGTLLRAQVGIETFPTDPQTGLHNYFGVRVTLSQTFDRDVTVNGYVYDDGGGLNTNHPFSLTVTSGYTTAETAANFYETDPTATAVAVVSSTAISYAGVTITYLVNDNILKFSSVSNAMSVLDQLDADDSTYNADYDSNQDTTLTDDQQDSVDIVNGYDEFAVLRHFESLFPGYSSKRAQIESTEESWLSSEFESTSPDDIDLTFDETENTIFNSDYSFKIGNDVYNFTTTGLYINSSLQDDAYFRRVIQGENTIVAGPMISQDDYQDHNTLPTDCKSNKKKIQDFSDGSQKFTLKVAIHSIAVRSGVKGKVVHFKKKNGHWKRSKTKMSVSIAGTYYWSACSSSNSFALANPSSGYKKRKSLKVMRHTTAQIPGSWTIWKTYSGYIGAGFDTPGSSAYGSLTLTF